jgi:hypothetical protein
MSEVGRRVKLEYWPYEGTLMEGTRGIVMAESARGLTVQWDGFTYPKGMRPEEVSPA